MRLTRLFLCTTALLLGLVSLMLAGTMWSDWKGLRTAESGLVAMELAYDAMQVAEKASAERGPSIPVLNGGTDPALRERLTQFRRATDEAFARTLQRLRDQHDPELLAALPSVERAWADLQAARAEVERVAELPLAKRQEAGSRLTRAPIDQLFAVIDTVMEGVTLLSAAAERIHPELSLALVGSRYAAELREHAGRLGSQFTAPLATQSPLGLQERDGIPRLLGRIEQLKLLLDVKARTSLSDTRIDVALQNQQRRYFETGLPFIAQLTQRGLSGLPYGVDSTQFVNRYVPEMRSIVELRDTLHAVGREQAQAKVEAAQRRLAVNAGLGLAIVALELAVFLTLRRRVLIPLLKSTRHMVLLMQGQLALKLPEAPRRDEIGDLQRAVRALQGSLLRTLELETERERLIDELRQLSHRDHLTGLMNRRAFDEQAPAQLAQASRHHWPCALLVLDIDHFKRINDRHGHDAGDAVLREVALRLQGLLREADLLARYGGEEFVALLPDCDPGAALALAERLRQALQAQPIELPDGSRVGLSASVGMAALAPQEHSSVSELFARADAALYEAKAGGRNQVRQAA